MAANEKLLEAIRLTEAMLRFAEAEEWDRLDPLDRQRQPLILAAFARRADDPDPGEVLRLKNLNDRIVTCLSRQRQQTRQQQLRMQQGQHAARQYSGNQQP